MATVALVGADGAGKTSIAREVARRLPNARYLYMGVNLEASALVLPTTRLALELKRRLGGAPDLSAPRGGRDGGTSGGRLGRLRRELRYANLILEEWFRALVAGFHARRGSVVVLDRHFVWDYHASLPPRGTPAAPGLRGLHDRLLLARYPRPDLVICLDAPAEVLLARKPGGTLTEREARRHEYLELGARTRRFVRIDVDRPPDLVICDVVDTITTHLEGGNDR